MVQRGRREGLRGVSEISVRADACGGCCFSSEARQATSFWGASGREFLNVRPCFSRHEHRRTHDVYLMPRLESSDQASADWVSPGVELLVVCS